MSFASIFKTILGRTDRDRRPAPRRDGAVSGNARKTVLAALTLVVGLPTVGEAQQAPELPKTPARDRQSVVNPFPRGTGSAQNRGRAENDWYWGMLDANRARGILPTSRVPNDAATPRTLELDGWSSDPSLRGDQRRGFLGGVFRSRPTLSVPVLAGDSNSTGTIVPTTGNAIWVLATGPSSQLLTGTYFRAAARPRPNVAPNGYNRENKFYWNLGSAAIPNTGTVLAPSPAAPGVNIASNTPFQQVRLSIRVRLPQPAPSTASPAENRISDARYVVFYYKRINNTNNPLLDFEARSAVFFVSQTGGGEETLVDAAGNPVFIPFFTSAANMAALPIQPGVGAAFQGVVLDDTTNNSGTDLYVIAEALRLAQNIDAVYGTPIVTAPHGGRLTGRYDQPNGPSVPYNGLHFRQQATNPGEQPLQPRTGPNYTTPYAFTGVSATELYNGSFDFANNPRDPKYTGIAFNAFFGPRDTSLTFEPWNPTTLFRGPESLIDPRFNGQRVSPGLGDRPQVPVRNPFTNQPIVLQNGQPVTRPAAPIDADNHDVYRTNLANASNLTTNPPVPFMSHFQVISARTEYVLDPRDEAGIGTIPVGKVYANDGATGAPIWQFPDRTYAPSNVRNRLVAVRDPVTGVTGNAAPIPGIFELDKDGDGVISDDEVFIVGQGNNVSGGIFASLSYQPRVKVRGNVQLPMYDRVTEANGRRRTRIRAFRNNVAPPQPWVMDSPPGRYYSAAWMPGGANQPVEVGVVFVGAANGVLYALDAYGNNDNDYSPHPTDSRIFGEFRNGTTNILWTFGKTSLPRQNYQGSNNLETTTELYYRRLQREIPATDSFGASTPVFAYQRDGRDIDPNSYTPADPNAALDPLTEELRMFVANRNGVLYALDAAADAGVRITATGVVVGVANLPIRKDSYTVQAYFNNQVIASPRSDVRWWFRARGGIDATPAVSVLRQDAGEGTIRKRPNAPGTNKPRFGGTPQQQAEKGVFVTGLDGRLYTLDWTGPIKATPNGNGTDKPINYSDATGQLLDATLDSGRLVSNAAINLNDDYQFHNVTPATPRAIADRREGTIRPRWTFPNLYQDIDGSGNRIDEPTDTAQANTTRKTDDPNAEIAPAAVVGRTLANASTTLGPITVPPVLVDFAWKDPVVATSQYVQKSFVLVQANDAVTSGLPATESRLYLLDQVGDRVNLLTNTTVRTLGAQQRVISHPRDRWSPKVLLGDAPPAWTYRYVFDTFNTGGTTASIDMALRNNPFDASATGRRQGVPGRKTLPTVYVGGVGSVYAIDFDFHTSLFTRYRPLLRNTGTVPNPLRFTENLTPVPSVPGVDALYPGVEAVADRLAPTDPLLTVNGRGLADRRILVRSVPLVGVPSRVSSITITAGPPQNRNSDVPVPGRPAPTVPTVPLLPTNDAPIYRPDYTSPDSTLRFDATDPTRDFSRFVNQDINDPLSTTAGAFNTDPNQTLQTRNNQAFQYPMLMVTDVDGNLHAVNSNTEGEDRISDPARSYTVGWPLYGFTDQIERQFTQIHSLQFSIQGPGGPGGVAVITNAYFPSLDPAYANTARAAANPTDPFRYYPYGEPNTTNPTPSSASAAAIPTNGNDDPRPDFRPRSLSQGVAGAVGPPAVTAVPADRHTGQTGFPLDLNGLFFDKRFAGLNNAVLPGTVLNTDPINVEQTQHPNGSYLVRTRLPGYSYIGGLIDSIDPAANKNNQLPEGARADIQAGANLVDDVNPAGQGVTWIYAGGLGGLLYAYTPTVVGQGSGFVAGTPNWFFGDNVPGTPYIAIVDRATYEQIRSDAADGVLSDATPTNISNGSFARRGLKNFYEWGETVYIVVYNLIASTQPETPSDYFVTGNGSVTLVFRQGAEADTESGREQVSMLRGTNNAISAYTFNGRQVGVALYALEINGASSTRPLSPGALISVTALPQEYLRADGRRGIATQALENSVNNSDVWFAIANPLAVQAYMASTAPNAAGQLELAGLPVGVGDTQNGIGPFAAESNPVGVKSQIAPRANVTTLTPDKAGFAYSQALTQGNRLRRRVLDRYNETGTGLNPRFRQILQQAAGGDEPEFYFPVIAGTGYAEHGKAAQSSINEVQNTLRILNRSLLPTLDGVRVVADKSALWRSWPGVIPNAPANVPATSVTPAINRNNPRNTPVGMDFLGRINPLPWETAPTDTQPWNPSALNNISQDYPDIPPTANFIQAEVAGIDLVRAAGSLSAAVDAGRTVNSSVGPTAAYNGVTPVPALYATNVKVNVPLYQPANLVATHSVTSTYYAPSSADIPPTVVNRAELGVTDGPVQLPTNPNGPAAGNGIASRNLRLFQNGSFNGARTISPFGYTTQMRVVVGPENLVAQPVQTRVTGRSPSDTFAQRVTNAGGAFREFEVGFGVTPDISMEVAGQNTQNSVIDLGSVGHSFGEQNGSLGYGGSDPIFATGFLPAPLADTGIFGANSPYQAFFKPFTIRNVGNVNLYNLRASQKVEVPQFQGAYTPGSGFPFAYVSMRSLTVDPRFGIMAAKADPRLPGGVAPQIVTSLDPRFDASWDRWIAAQPEFATPTADGTTPYQVFYQQFGGRHTLHKPVPGGAPTVLNVPDVPSRDIRPGEQQPNGLPTVVGVAVPLGTPSGTYSTVNGSVPFVVFEDHDTDINYAGVPTTNGIARFDGTLPVTAAGPLYGGSNESHPGKVRNIRSRGNGSNGEGIYRPRNLVINGTGRRLEYLPSAPGGANSPGTTVSGATASDSMNIKIEVREAPLTGDIIDIALGAAVSIVTGRLPGIDLYPLIDRSTTTQRPAYALTPAAYRSANGNLNVYFSRNYQGDPTGRFAQPGQAYNLFHTHMIWNSALGTWQASSPGVPVNGVLVNTGKWFTDALPIAVPDPIPGVTDPAEANQSNTSPAVLTGNSGAALYWLNTVPRSSGQPYSQIMVGSLDANGVPTGQPQPFIERYDPARQRYQPRPLFLTAGTDAYALVFYYGGTDGKWNLYYNLRAAGQDGFPIGAPANALTSNNSAEIPLPLPSTFVSATDPSPVLHPQFVPIIGNRAIPDTVVDVYFSGITRNRPQAEIYMARYRVVAVPGGLPRLSATADDTRGQLFLMPRVFSEPLRRQGRSNLYQAQHIAWYDRLTDNPRTAGYDDRQSLPVITIRYGGQTANSVTVGPANWQAEPSSGILYQSFTRNGQETIVYVNTIAGTVQFRGTPGQGVPVDADTVLADYQPSVYRLTDGEGSKTGAYLVHDTRPLYRISGNQVTGAFQPAFNYTGAVFRRLISNNNTAEANVPIAGRLWIFYQKGATNGRGTLTWQVRRVGFNLNSIRYEDGGLKGAPEVLPDGRPAPKGIALSDPNANGNQFPIITRVIVGNGVGAVPYDVDFARGILFVGPQYHGLPVQITYQRAADNQTITLTDGVGGQRLRLDYIPDTYPASPEPPADNRNNPPPPTVVVAGNEVTLTQSVNETQPFAFLDLFNPLPGINRTGIEMPDALTDPTLQIGRLWLLWSSPRSRLGVAGNAADPFPQGFDIFWQTFAPEFNLTSSPAR